MTQERKKKTERYFIEEVSKLLGTKWNLDADREAPDFLVTENGQRFGLEVCEIFKDRVLAKEGRSRGSQSKRAESENQRAVNVLQAQYEASGGPPLIVKFLGNTCMKNMNAVVPKLIAKNFSSYAITHQETLDFDEASPDPKLRVFVTLSLKADWFNVKDRGGFVNTNPINQINEAITAKAGKLPQYKASTGLSDIRLLIVANRRMNSGKLLIQEPLQLSTQGFSVVYFYSLPETVTVFNNDRSLTA